MRYTKTVCIMVGLLAAFASAAADTLHFYVYTGSTGTEPFAITCELNSTQPSSPGVDFAEVSADSLHALGLKTPSEYEQEAVGEDVGSFGTTGSCASWGSKYTAPDGKKYVVMGSSTTRFLIPGDLFLGCSTYVHVSNPPGPTSCVNWHVWSTWGWETKWTYKSAEYPQSQIKVWAQKGRHHWGNPNDMHYSSYTLMY
jgi:hypothetical protein